MSRLGGSGAQPDNPIESRHLTWGCQTGAMMGAVPLAIELKDVRKHFGPVQAVRDVDLSIASGEIVAMLGPNGAGKTSTIDIILGLSRQTSGQALVFGMHPRQAVTRGLVSAVMQTGGLLKDLTVKETV